MKHKKFFYSSSFCFCCFMALFKTLYGRASLPAPDCFKELRGDHRGPPVQDNEN
jgi:hypothetical protein